MKTHMSYFKRFFGHLKTILTHKYWVLYYSIWFGYPLPGVKHDLSKFSPVEFFESVKYWDGKRSPILAAKENDGISYAWLHHRGKNKHHYEYWVDKLDEGGVPYKMPFKYVVEMVCDWLAAARTYNGITAENVFIAEWEWWKKKRDVVKMHEETKNLVTTILAHLAAGYLDHKGKPSAEREALMSGVGIIEASKKYYEDKRVDFKVVPVMRDDTVVKIVEL